MYSIKTVSKLAGVNAATIRSWERRYQALAPQRDEAGRRVYDDDDLARLKLLTELVRDGHSVGRIARLSLEELDAMKDKTAPVGRVPRGPAIVESLMEAVQEQDFEGYQAGLGSVLAALPPVEVAESVIVPVMRRVGELWSRGQLTIATEHAVSAITKQAILSQINVLRWAHTDRRIALASLPGERHEMGVLLGYYVAASQGLSCIYFGPDLPIEDIVGGTMAMRAEILVLGSVLPDLADEHAKALQEIAEALPASTSIWLGAGSASSLATAELPPRVLRFTSFEPFLRLLVQQAH